MNEMARLDTKTYRNTIASSREVLYTDLMTFDWSRNPIAKTHGHVEMISNQIVSLFKYVR